MSRLIAITAALCWALLTALPASAQSDEDAVRAVVTDFHNALAEGYRDGVLRLLADDAVIFETGYVEASREQYAAGHLDADLLYAATVRREPVHRQVKVVGDLAYVISQSRSRGEFQGEAVNLTNTETMVLRRSDADWRIVHIHWSGHEARPDTP
jgi:uncharacterized protein (TIGR02246 family)